MVSLFFLNTTTSSSSSSPLRILLIVPKWQQRISLLFFLLLVWLLFISPLVVLLQQNNKSNKSNKTNHNNHHHHHSFFVFGKEIVATKEWTKLDINDTIAAGMHVRIDMTTGEKWVKIPDDTNDDNDTNANNYNTNVQEKDSGTSLIVQTTNTNTISVSNSMNDNDNDNENDYETVSVGKPKYDFDAMYRTLSGLPEDEKIAMDLPHLPKSSCAGGNSNREDTKGSNVLPTTDEERKLFEEKMTKIWEHRQKQLNQIQNELVADLPKILKERITSIQHYSTNPKVYINHILQMKQMQQEQKQKQEQEDNQEQNQERNQGETPPSHHDDDNNDNDNDNDNKEGSSSSSGVQSDDIISILIDLEYHLSDVDMARDFHTMGGWSILVSLLADEVHYGNTVVASSSSSTSANPKYKNDSDNRITEVVATQPAADAAASDDDGNDEKENKIIVDTIQMHVAWILGTAVKNTGEFTPYVMEEVYIGNETKQGRKTTPLDLILYQIQKTMVTIKQCSSSSNNRNANGNIIVRTTTNKQKPDVELYQKKLDKLLYCLGSFLRGNRRAQIHFGATNGPMILRQTLLDLLSYHDNNNNSSNNYADNRSRSTTSIVSNINYNKIRIKMIQRLLQLSADIVTEVTSIQQKYDHTDPTIASTTSSSTVGSTIMSPEISNAIVQTFTVSTDWCSTIVLALDPTVVFPIVTVPTTATATTISNDNTTATMTLVDESPYDMQTKITYSDIALTTATTLAPHCLALWKQQQQYDDDENENEQSKKMASMVGKSIAGWIHEWDKALQLTDGTMNNNNNHKNENNNNINNAEWNVLDLDRYQELLLLAQKFNNILLEMNNDDDDNNSNNNTNNNDEQPQSNNNNNNYDYSNSSQRKVQYTEEL